jgi:Fe(3+) dicitrate transport protein
MKKSFLIIVSLIFSLVLFSQEPDKKDTTIHSRILDSVTVLSYINQNIVRTMSPLQGVYMFNGKKTELIDLSHIPADITNKTARQVFSKIPGLFGWSR